MKRKIKILEKDDMLWTIAALLTVVWLIGVVSGYTMGGLIHVLLAMAVIVVFLKWIKGRRIA
jgi:hypothetical protein